MFYDVFNGDADGIFALHQHRHFFPVEKERQRLITGVKRDVRLLGNIDDSGQQICVFDISLAANSESLQQLLAKGNQICWFDHHFAGRIPNHPLLQATINPDTALCTAAIVGEALKVAPPLSLWAIAAAFGDNLHDTAEKLAQKASLQATEITQLAELGELFNYNGYGNTLDDLHFHPAELYQAIQPYRNPLDFIAKGEELQQLRNGYHEDMDKAKKLATLEMVGKNRVYIFPDAPWARRVSGVFANKKAREEREIAHAIITEHDDFLRISVRAPLDDPRCADTLCRKFSSGGGRAAAAGINTLPKESLSQFYNEFIKIYP